MGRHKQHSLLLYNLLISLEPMHICILFHWLVGGYKPYFAQDITKRRRLEIYKSGRQEREGGLLWGQPAPMSWRYQSNKDLSVWAELSWAELYLVRCFKPFILSLQIFIVMRQELRKRNKPTWDFYTHFLKSFFFFVINECWVLLDAFFTSFEIII